MIPSPEPGSTDVDALKGRIAHARELLESDGGMRGCEEYETEFVAQMLAVLWPFFKAMEREGIEL